MPRAHIALVGCGRWGRLILRDLRSLDCQVTVVASSRSSIEGAVAGGADTIVGEVDLLPTIDGIVVAVPTVAHAEVILALADREVPIYVEKPVATSIDDVDRIAVAAPGRVFVMDKWRYHPGVRVLARLASSGALGVVAGLRTVRTQWGNHHSDVDGLWTLLPHDLVIALDVLGSVPAVRHAVAHVDADEVTGMFALLEEPDGRWHEVEVSTHATRPERRIEVFGSDGIAVLAGGWDDIVSVYRGKAEPVVETVSAAGELPLLAELRAFIAHVEGGPPPLSNLATGRRVVQTIADLRAAAGIA